MDDWKGKDKGRQGGKYKDEGGSGGGWAGGWVGGRVRDHIPHSRCLEKLDDLNYFTR